MRKATILKVSAASLAALLVFATWIRAGRAVIDEVQITEEFGCTRVLVEFNFPVRYVNHFPRESGDDLRVQLEPIITRPADREALLSREEPLLPPGALESLVEVVYEGNVDGGPYLTLFFDREMKFGVEQGPDFRSLLISVSDAASNGSCRKGP